MNQKYVVHRRLNTIFNTSLTNMFYLYKTLTFSQLQIESNPIGLTLGGSLYLIG